MEEAFCVGQLRLLTVVRAKGLVALIIDWQGFARRYLITVCLIEVLGMTTSVSATPLWHNRRKYFGFPLRWL